MQINFNNAKFVKGAHNLGQCLPDVGVEIAIAGCSNAGKSSALNTITGINGLARVSKRPGRTQQINYFQLAERCYLVDLPGYGYARVSPKLRQHWDLTLGTYFKTRQSLRGLVVIIDIRRSLRDLDRQLIEWVTDIGIPIHCLLTKSDKLGKSRMMSALQQTSAQLALIDPTISLQLFSAFDLRGVGEARAQMEKWLLGS